MKKKLLITLLLVTLVSMGVGYYTSQAIDQVVFKINNIVKIQKVQLLQEKLVFQLRKVQHGLVAKDTQFASDINTLTTEVAAMSTTMNSCFKCHHSEHITSQLKQIQNHMELFKLALSRSFTIRANLTRYNTALHDAFAIGEELASQLNQLISTADKTLTTRENLAMHDIGNTQLHLQLLVTLIPILVLVIGLFLLRSFSQPLSTLLDATRKLSAGNLSHRVVGLRHEFGELASSFNTMAESIMQQMKSMQRAEQMSAVGQLAAGLAHEIKNPLAGIKVSMEVLATELDIDEDDRRILRMVILEINHINALINELLNYAKPSAPKFELVDVNKTLTSTIEAITFGRGTHSLPGDIDSKHIQHIKFTKKLAAQNLHVNADPAQLYQIVLNILLNCVDCMAEGGEITIQSYLPEGTDYICINISDTGPGMDSNVLEKLFDPFFTTKKKGTGLGMAITKRLVEQHDGEVVAINNPDGIGASFSVYLPVYSINKEIV